MSATDVVAEPEDPSALPEGITERRRPRIRVTQVLFWAAVIWLTTVTFLAVFANLLPIQGPDEADFQNVLQRPGWRWPEFLGTDQLGRSELSRIIYGARVSLLVGVLSPLIGMIIGGSLGMMAGYARGWFDRTSSILFDSMLAFPPLILLAVSAFVFGRDLWKIVLALAILNIPTFARLTRANTLVFSEREFVRAAKGMGAKGGRIVFREILPNVIFPVIAFGFVIAGVLVVAEGILSFLGLSVAPPNPSWGNMIEAGKNELEDDPHLVFIPAIVFFLTVFSINTIGDRMRQKFDVRESAL